MRPLIAGLAALAMTGCATVSRPLEETPPAALAEAVIRQINSYYVSEDPKDRPPVLTRPPPGALTGRDVDQDGRTDWIIAWPPSSQFCGTGGCRMTLYLGSDDGLRRVFDRQTLDVLAITKVDGETRIESWFHHSLCRYEPPPCRMAWGLDRQTGRLVPRPSADGRTFSAQDEQGPIDEIWDPAM